MCPSGACSCERTVAKLRQCQVTHCVKCACGAIVAAIDSSDVRHG